MKRRGKEWSLSEGFILHALSRPGLMLAAQQQGDLAADREKKEAEWRCVCGKDLYANELQTGLTVSLFLPLFLSVTHTLFSSSFLSFFPSCGQFGAEGLEDAVIQKSCLLKLCVPMTLSFVLLCDCQSACVCVSECIQFSFSLVHSFVCVCACLALWCFR